MELRNKKLKDENDGNTSSPAGSAAEETPQPPRDDASNDTNVVLVQPKRKKKDGKGSSKSISLCRFCKQKFESPQALGGHMNRHRGEREKEEFQKAETLIHTKGQNYASVYPRGGGGPSYMPNDYQQGGNSGNPHYQGGGTQMANASMMPGNMGGGLQRHMYQNSNQQFVAAPQMNPSYGTHQQQIAQQANYQSQPQHGGSYIHYNQGDNAPGPPHIPVGVPQTSYRPRANSGLYQAQVTGSLRDVKPYAMPQGGSTGVGHHPSNTGFSGHFNQAAGGANMLTLDNTATLGIPAGSNSSTLRQTTANQATVHFVDQSGNLRIQGPSSGYSTGLRPLNPSHFHDSTQATEYDQEPQDHYIGQASYGTSVHGAIHLQSEQYAAVGMENQYQAPGVEMLDFDDAHEGDEFGNGGPDLSNIAVTESGHGGSVSTGRSADAISHP